MNQEKKDFCFCTLAFSETYRTLALELAGDLQKYSPETVFIVYTDKPQQFKDCSNVLVFKHRQKGVFCYHERRFAIAKALSLYNSCIYLDADVRIVAPVSPDLKWLPGITARSCDNLVAHHNRMIYKNGSPRLDKLKNFEIIQKTAQNLDVNLEEVTYLNEFLFVVTRDAGRELEFLKQWEKIALSFELQGLHKGPGNAMGIAATKVGFPIRHDVMEGISFFDDRIERERIKKGQADPNASLIYFEKQKSVELAKRSPTQKALLKLNRTAAYLYHSARLRITTLGNSDLYK